MISLKKIPSLESYDVDGSTLRQIVNFEFDAGFYDLNSSCLILPTTITSVETTPALKGVHNVSLTHRANVMVKNCRFSTTRAGILEEMTHNNFRNINLEKFTRGTSQNQSQAFFDGANFQDEFSNNYSNFRLTQKRN